MQVNQRALDLLLSQVNHLEAFGVNRHVQPCGSTIYDFGVDSPGTVDAGCLMAQVATGGQATIELEGDRPSPNGPWSATCNVLISTGDPVAACLGAQYAGWPITTKNYFAMGSGPMRALRGKEKVLEQLHLHDASDIAVGLLESDQLPDQEVCQLIADGCKLDRSRLHLLVAPTSSLCGTLQVVARSVETALHKLVELEFDVRQIERAYGRSPLPPVAKDSMTGIGWTNDSILYGAHVNLFVNTTDDVLRQIGPQIPSSASRDFGEPFQAIFKRYDHDFYKIDPLLFSPAVVTLHNLRTENQFTFGEQRIDILEESYRH